MIIADLRPHVNTETAVFQRVFFTFFSANHIIVLSQENLKGIEMQDYMYETNIDRFPVAMAYVPWQKFDKMYDDLEKAYRIGTIFPELDKPFTGRRCV